MPDYVLKICPLLYTVCGSSVQPVDAQFSAVPRVRKMGEPALSNQVAAGIGVRVVASTVGGCVLAGARM